MNRSYELSRQTAETSIQVRLNLDGTGKHNIHTGIPFLDHMLTQIARHGLFDLDIQAEGDLAVDFHHTVEDIGIVLGKVWRQALGDCRGIQRFGEATIPLDESLSRVVVDLSNRPYLVWKVVLPTERIGQFDCELFKEWFAAFASHAAITLHVENFYGQNSHHIIESCFKALAKALQTACQWDKNAPMDQVPSSKGTLST